MSIYIDIALSRRDGREVWLMDVLERFFMGLEEGREKMRVEIARSTMERIFESLVNDVVGLTAKLALGVIDARGFIEGLQLLIPRLARFAPGGAASRILQRCETILLNALTEGQSMDENPGCEKSPGSAREEHNL